MLKVHDAIPHFSLPDQHDKIHHTDEYKGKWLLVYFYPKDDTPGCTKEACAFRDGYSQFQEQGVTILGISKDSVQSHQKFQEKYHLPFTLLSDTSGKTIQAFGAWGKKKFMGREYLGILRTTFLIDPEGKIAQVYENVDPATHAEQILGDLGRLNNVHHI